MIKSAHCVTERPDQAVFQMHAHENYEIFCFLSGDASYAVEGTCYRLRPGDLMLIRKKESHHLILHGDGRYERLIVNFDLPFLREIPSGSKLLEMFDDRPLGAYNHYSAALFPDHRWTYLVQKICTVAEPHRKLAFLMALLGELAEPFEAVRAGEFKYEPDSVAAMVQYINNHLTEDLSLAVLSSQFYLSKAHLNRIFKRTTGSTVWNYIITKRLLQARELLNGGMPPAAVCACCGFRDYTTFFRAYKKQFGISPKSQQNREL